MKISKEMFWFALFGGIGGMVITALLFKILPPRGEQEDDAQNRNEAIRPQNCARFRQGTKFPQEHDER